MNKEKSIPIDLFNLIKKAIKINLHLRNNRKDIHNKRFMNITESKIRKLEKYYLKKKILPKGWKYSSKTAELIVK